MRKLRACSGYAHAPSGPENVQMMSGAASLRFSLCGRVIRSRCLPLANAERYRCRSFETSRGIALGISNSTTSSELAQQYRSSKRSLVGSGLSRPRIFAFPVEQASSMALHPENRPSPSGTRPRHPVLLRRNDAQTSARHMRTFRVLSSATPVGHAGSIFVCLPHLTSKANQTIQCAGIYQPKI